MRTQRAAGRLAATSSIMVSWGFLAVTGAGAAASLFWGKRMLAAFLLFVGVLCLASRLWGRCALRDVSVAITAESAGVYAGDEVVLHYSIANAKFLPLVWLELLQPTPPNGCLMPEADFERYELSVQEKREEDRELVVTVLRKKFAFILWHQTLEWESRWRAVRRGMYPLATVLLRSGDGFGLSQLEREYPVAGSPVFVVYPKLVPVRVELFLQNLWDAASGAKGHFEDPTVMRGARAYQSGNPWKRINWRMAARREDLEIKLYETIMPQSVHFLLDGGSFLGRDADNAALETAISLLASAAVRLEEARVRCGLSLPAAGATAAVNLFAAKGGARATDLLFALAGYQPETAAVFDEAAIVRAKEGIGQVYFVTWEVANIACKSLLEELGAYGVTILPWQTAAGGADWADYRIVPLHSIEGGGGNG